MTAFNLWMSSFLIVLLIIDLTNAHESLTQEEILRIYQQLSQDNEPDTDNTYDRSVIHGESISDPDSISSVSVEFHIKNPDTIVGANENKEDNGDRSNRRRRIIRIKNPRKNADGKYRQIQEAVDSNPASSNQYAAIQYALPPDDFINQMRIENQIQQQNIAQYSTTQQPIYQYKSMSLEPSQQIGQTELHHPSATASSLHQGQQFNTQYKSNPDKPILQFASSGHTDNYQVTPSPSVHFLSSPNPNNQYTVTPGSVSFVSSVQSLNPNLLSQIQYSHQPEEQNYASTPIPEYGSRVNPSSSTPFNENTGYNRDMQIDHFNHASNGIQYPFTMQQFPNEVTTTIPVTTTAVSNQLEKAWRLNLNGKQGYDSMMNLDDNLQLSLSNGAVNRQQGFGNELTQQNRNRYEYGKPYVSGIDHETGRQTIYSHGDYGWKLNGKNSNYEVGSSGARSAYYSTENTLKPVESSKQDPVMSEISTGQNFNNIKSSQSFNYNSESSSPQDVNVGYSIGFGSNINSNNVGMNQVTKNSMKSDDNNQNLLEFHRYNHNKNNDNMKNTSNVQSNTAFQINLGNLQNHPWKSISPITTGDSQGVVSTFYGNLYTNSGTPIKDQYKSNYYGPNTELLSSSESKHHYEQLNRPYIYTQMQPDLVTAFPYSYNIFPENVKVNPHFDHAKALKNIQPIGFTNVVQNTERAANNFVLPYYVNGPRYAQHSPSIDNAFINIYASKDQDTKDLSKNNESNHFENYRDYNRPLTDFYYKDKNVGYGLSIKSKPDLFVPPTEGLKLKNSFTLNSQKQTPYKLPMTYLQNENLKQLQNTNTDQTQASFPLNYQSHLNREPEYLKSSFQINNINNPSPLYPLGPIKNLNSQVIRLNQDISSHNLEAPTNFLNKHNMLSNKQIDFKGLRELNLQNEALTTVNGIKIANPFNVDLNLVSELLKARPAVSETRTIPYRDRLNRMVPLKLDTSSFPQMLSKSENANIQKQDLIPTLHGKNDYNNYGTLPSLGYDRYRSPNEKVENNPSSFDDTQYDESAMTDTQNSYQSIFKHSRSQEGDDGGMPIITAEASNIHPIGAVIDQAEINQRQETESTYEDEFSNINSDEQESLENEDVKKTQIYALRDSRINVIDNIPNFASSGKKNIPLKQLNEADEPYPLLKPPRPPSSRALGYKNNENRLRFHRADGLRQNKLPNKTGYFTENPSAKNYGVKLRAPLNFKPPTVLKRTTSKIIRK